MKGNSRSSSIGVQAKAPTMIWYINTHKEATPLLPVSPQYCPTSPIENLIPNSNIIARFFPTKDGWKACCVMPIPIVGTKYIWNRLWLEWLELQRCNKRIFWEDILRYRSELLYRSTLEYCFLYAKEETQRCLDLYFLPVTKES